MMNDTSVDIAQTPLVDYSYDEIDGGVEGGVGSDDGEEEVDASAVKQCGIN